MKQQRAPELPSTRNPGVKKHDHVYFREGQNVMCGHVRACGEHGATILSDAGTHRVTWDRVIGHKKRAKVDVTVVDQGEDGAIVEDAEGRRFFLRSLDEHEEGDEPMHKSLPSGAVLALFVKALPAAKGKAEEKPKKGKDKPDVANARAEGFPHAHGASVRFKAGTLRGKGKIVARGRDGATIEDADKRRHQVHWHEMEKDEA
mgnify:FL=1